MTRRKAPEPAPAKAAPGRKNVTLTLEEDGAMREMGGSAYGVFNHNLVDSVMRTAWVPLNEGEDRNTTERRAMGAVVATLKAFAPKDEIEGLLAAQATAMHLASMEAFRRAIIPEQGAEVASKLRRDAVNLSRGMTDMLTALAKHRGQGQQKVVVEHVHVHAGGQAVVGTVSTSGALPATGADVLALTGSDGSPGLDDAVLVDLATGDGRGVR